MHFFRHCSCKFIDSRWRFIELVAFERFCFGGPEVELLDLCGGNLTLLAVQFLLKFALHCFEHFAGLHLSNLGLERVLFGLVFRGLLRFTIVVLLHTRMHA